MDNDLKTFRSILRKLRWCEPSSRTFAASGISPALLARIAEAEGLQIDPRNPDLWISWMPARALDASAIPAGVRAATLVASSLANAHHLPPPRGREPAKLTVNLREWVAIWPGGRLLAQALAPDAVGGKSCSPRIPGSWQWTFSRSTPAAARSPLREAAVTAFGTGTFPVMPATLLCLLMLPPALALHTAAGGPIFQIAAALAALLATLGSLACEKWASERFLSEDPREFVLDEVAGMALAWTLLPASSPGWLLVAAFFTFRFFDIFKPAISWIERLPIPGKIVWDDLLAGLYAGLLTAALSWILPT